VLRKVGLVQSATPGDRISDRHGHAEDHRQKTGELAWRDNQAIVPGGTSDGGDDAYVTGLSWL
jgi:hypothetical protein